MIVALGALERSAKEDGAGGVHAINDLVHAIFLRMHAGLHVAGGRAMETGGDTLRDGGVRQKVAGDLLDDKLVERHARVQRVDDPITVGPAVTQLVGLKAVAVSIAREVEPWTRPALAIARAF